MPTTTAATRAISSAINHGVRRTVLQAEQFRAQAPKRGGTSRLPTRLVGSAGTTVISLIPANGHRRYPAAATGANCQPSRWTSPEVHQAPKIRVVVRSIAAHISSTATPLTCDIARIVYGMQ